LGGERESYRRIHGLIATGLARLGAAVELAPPRPAGGPQDGACFASSAGGEIVAGGHKLVGSAQYRRAGAVLQHGSVLLEDDQSLVAEVARSPARPAGGGAAGEPGISPPRTPAGAGAITLSSLLGRRVEFDEVATAIAAVFADTWGPGTSLACPPAPVARRAETLGPAFRDPAWTWRR
jgi:lipoate-protein ligase A